SPSSTPPSTSSSHGPHDQSSLHSRAASYAQISTSTRLTSSFVSSAIRENPSGSSCGTFLDDSVRHVGRHLGVVVELHRVRGSALAHRAQHGRVAEHLGQRNLRANDLA